MWSVLTRRDVDFRHETSRKLNRNFEGSFSSRALGRCYFGMRSFSHNDFLSVVMKWSSGSATNSRERELYLERIEEVNSKIKCTSFNLLERLFREMKMQYVCIILRDTQ